MLIRKSWHVAPFFVALEEGFCWSLTPNCFPLIKHVPLSFTLSILQSKVCYSFDPHNRYLEIILHGTIKKINMPKFSENILEIDEKNMFTPLISLICYTDCRLSLWFLEKLGKLLNISIHCIEIFYCKIIMQLKKRTSLRPVNAPKPLD